MWKVDTIGNYLFTASSVHVYTYTWALFLFYNSALQNNKRGPEIGTEIKYFVKIYKTQKVLSQ